MNHTEQPQEGHNNIPKGWLFFFFGTIIFLVWYIVSFTPAISGWSFYKEFEKEMTSASTAAPAQAARPDRYIGDSKATLEGKSDFATTCAACHNADATGGIGPNLRAATLKYGSKPGDLYDSIANGRPNGMPPFLQQLGGDRISKVVAFLASLRK